MEQAIQNYLNNGGSISILKPKEKRPFKLVCKIPMKKVEIEKVVKRIKFMGRDFLRRVK